MYTKLKITSHNRQIEIDFFRFYLNSFYINFIFKEDTLNKLAKASEQEYEYVSKQLF